MHHLLRQEVKSQIRAFKLHHPLEYDLVKRAWNNARDWADTSVPPPADVPILTPYVGSGLNRLAEGGLRSWDDLVKLLARHGAPLGDDHAISRSGLSMPEQLEMHLREAALDPAKKAAIREELAAVMRSPAEPTVFYKHLAVHFPILLTTNYNDLLSLSAEHESPLTMTPIADQVCFRS